jgi:hypothetical protein
MFHGYFFAPQDAVPLSHRQDAMAISLGCFVSGEALWRPGRKELIRP